MSVNLKISDISELKPRITVFGTGGAGGNAVNNMIASGLQGVDFVVANTDAQALTMSKAERIIQMGVAVTEGLGAGSQPEVGRAAAEEVIDEIRGHLKGAHMAFVTAGMGGGTGTGAAPVVARCAKSSRSAWSPSPSISKACGECASRKPASPSCTRWSIRSSSFRTRTCSG
jgi:cell division protein FtsZ